MIFKLNQKYQRIQLIQNKQKEYKSESQSQQSQYFSMEKEGKQPFTIIHFNDVYDIQPDSKGQGGILNFYEQVERLRKKHKNSILLFSGDCFSPSSLTNVFKGSQMVQALNFLKINAACYGNHQFDLGSDRFQQLSRACTFDWLQGNIKYHKVGNNGKAITKYLGIGKEMKTIQIAGYKLGIFGLASKEWQNIIGGQYEGCLQCQDIGEYSNKICKKLRQEKCDIIIALTHMKVQQDLKIPGLCKDIDIILGGHDHIVYNQTVDNVPILKSGENFKKIGVVQVYEKSSKQNQNCKGKKFNFNINVLPVPVLQKTQGCKMVKDFLKEKIASYEVGNKVIGYTKVQLDMNLKRTKQTNYGNFLADLMRYYFSKQDQGFGKQACVKQGCHIAVLNSGSVRFNKINKGEIKLMDVSNMYYDALIMKSVSGKAILSMLQNSVKSLPGESGSFLFVSGIKFTYNINKKDRVQKQTVMVGKQKLDQNKFYNLVTRQYLFSGNDSYTSLSDPSFKSIDIEAITIVGLLLKFFEGGIKNKNNALFRKPSLEQNPIQQSNLKLFRTSSINSNLSEIPNRKPTYRQLKLKKLMETQDLKDDNTGITYYSINPKIDGRIKEQK